MPVQINEMVIRANILETSDDKEERTETNESKSEANGMNKNEIIKECAELVLEILNNKNQR